MIVFRLSRTKWVNDLTGEGSRLKGGRWNHKGTACIYTSESRALATLEYTVNVPIDEIPRALSLVTLEIPDTHIQAFTISDLPGNWQEIPSPPSTKDFGTRLLKAAAHPVIRFPSSVIQEEFNFILNPIHAESKLFKIIEVKDFVYDVRIKLV